MSKLFTFYILIVLSLLLVGFAVAQSVPESPTNLTVELMMTNVKLHWDAASGATGYKVYKAIDTLPFVPIALVKITTSYIDPMILPGHVYRYYVTALNYVGESLPSNDVVFTPDGNPPQIQRGVIAGTIIDDTTGLPIPCVRLRFFTPDGFMYFREARTDTFGYYSMHIDTGKYLIYVTKWTYVPEWYDNVQKPQYATIVPVTHGDTSVANFGLTRIPIPPPLRMISVSGTVTDSLTGDPIRGAYVVIMRPNRMVNMIQNHEGSMFGSRSETFLLPDFGTLLGVIRVVRTDSNGNYLAKVPDSLRYVMLAFKLEYIPEFYKDKRTPFDADRLFLTSDTSGINFDLVPNPNIQNSVSGKIKNADGDGVFSKVVLFNITPRGFFPVRCAISDTDGNYSFNYLVKGLYFAKAVPFAYYYPAWYDHDTCGTVCWFNAEPFLVDSVTAGIDICVQPVFNIGLASISGTVVEIQSSEIVQGVTVYAVSKSSNSIVGYDITEDDGIFSIQNLAPDTYTIVVDKEGYNATDTPDYVVSAVNNFTVDDAEISLTSVTVGVEEKTTVVPQKYSLEQNYPNPFNPTTEIRFALPVTSNINISVYNILGQEVATLFTGELPAGNHSVTWNGQNARGTSVGNGVYFYKITANSVGNTNTFTNVKKMMLVK